MAIKKVRIRPEGGNNYADVLHPETSADIVIESENKMFVSSVEKTNWNNKADKTYVDTELNKRYLKEQVFTKEEVLQKIQDVIGTAPEALDTLQEIAEALNNDANFAGTIINELSKKVDKIEGKQLSTEDYTTAEKNKLAGIEEGANKTIINNTLTSTSTTQALSASQGKALKDDLDAHKADYIHLPYSIADGTNNYTTLINGISSLVEGMSIKVKFQNANTGTATLNINGLGAKEIRKSNGNALSAGNIKAGQICHLVYTGSVFQLLGEGGEYGTAQPEDVLRGKTIGTEEGLKEGTAPRVTESTEPPSGGFDGDYWIQI